MHLAKKLRGKHVVAYLLYMFQVEDVLRAYNLDVEAIRTGYLPRFRYTEEQRTEAVEWYAHLADMMREEGVREKGHLQVVRNTMLLLEDFHQELLDNPKAVYYQEAYRKALPCIVDLRAHGARRDVHEIENCLDALYGISVLKMKGGELKPATEGAIKPVAQLLEMLSALYNNEKNQLNK